jgi:hypothetical protein
VTIVVAGGSRRVPAGEVGLVAAQARVEQLVSEGMARSAAAKQVAKETGQPRRELFVRR